MKVAIIDDFKTDRDKTALFLHKYFAENFPQIVLETDMYENGETFLRRFIPGTYQIILVDYYMDQLSGLDLAKHIREAGDPAILIFVTASPDYAIAGYKVKASGYLVKPIQYEELAELLSLLEIEACQQQEYIEFVNGYRTCRVLLDDIAYCDISGHYAQIHTLGRKMERTRMTFQELTRLLEPYPQFLCCYRGCIVNMDHIKSLDEFNFILVNGERIPIRRKEHSKILQTYSDYVFMKTRKRNLWTSH